MKTNISQSTRSNKKSNFTIIESLTLFSVLVVILVGIYFTKNLFMANDIKSLAMQIRKYDDAVSAFADKYEALPGDICKTQYFGITKENTDGNCDNIVNDANEKIVSANGEITKFWMHLSQTNLLEEKFDGSDNEKAEIGTSFPISKIGDKIGIIAYGDEGKTFYQIGFKYSNSHNIIMSDKSLKPYESYLFDEKIDDGNPKKGRVVTVGGNQPNHKENEECVKNFVYNQSNNHTSCQLRIEIQ